MGQLVGKRPAKPVSARLTDHDLAGIVLLLLSVEGVEVALGDDEHVVGRAIGIRGPTRLHRIATRRPTIEPTRVRLIALEELDDETPPTERANSLLVAPSDVEKISASVVRPRASSRMPRSDSMRAGSLPNSAQHGRREPGTALVRPLRRPAQRHARDAGMETDPIFPASGGPRRLLLWWDVNATTKRHRLGHCRAHRLRERSERRRERSR